MTLKELKERVDMAMSNERNADLEVCIPNNKGGMGGLSTTRVKSAHKGIDWNSGSFFIWPEVEMVERQVK